MATRPPREDESALPPEVLHRIGRVLREHEGFDVAGYRPSYIARRIASRASPRHEALREYAARVETDKEERRALVEALGVNVTAFFRDPSVWTFLEEVALPPVVDEKMGAGETLRVLSLGCAGGQEAYSAAMLLAELSGGDLESFEVEAWDMDPGALAVAQEAWYPEPALATVAPAAVARYFDAREGGFRVKEPLRQRVHVRRHDMLVEPIRERFDAIFLRNVVIYFQQSSKEELFERVHASLTTRGILVLGQAETMMGRVGDRFRPLSLRNRVYAKAARG